MDRGNKRDLPNLEDDEEPRKRTSCSCCCHSFKSQPVLEADDHVEPVSAEDLQTAQRKLNIQLDSYTRKLVDSYACELVDSYTRKLQLIDKPEKFKLRFVNCIASTVYTGNDIVAVDGKPLEVAIFRDATDSSEIIKTGPLSRVKVEIFVLPGDQQYEKIITEDNGSEFYKNILFQRDGKRPLIVGDDQKICLKGGVGLIKNLSFTDNSSWTKSKMFRITAKVMDKEIFAEFPKIEEAISEPFRVFDQRGEANKKHCHPKEEDEVWRLKGISKNGIYHHRLLSKDIKTVGDFLKIYAEMGDDYLKKLLGNKVPKKTWNAMVHNAFECISHKVPNEATVPLTAFNPTIEQNLVRNEAMGVALNHNFTLQDFDFLFEGIITDNFSLFPR